MRGAVISRFWLMLFPTQWNMAIVFRGLEQFYCCKGVIGGDEKFEVAIIAWSGRKVEFRKGDWRLKMRKGKRVKWNYIKVLHCFYIYRDGNGAGRGRRVVPHSLPHAFRVPHISISILNDGRGGNFSPSLFSTDPHPPRGSINIPKKYLKN